MRINKTAILGTGLIGTSLALALKYTGITGHISGYDLPETVEKLTGTGIYDSISDSLGEVLDGACLVFICLPVGKVISILHTTFDRADRNALIIDTGSTKASILKKAGEYRKHPVQFIGGHPMAGREICGWQAADSTLFQNRPFFLIPSETVTEDNLDKCRELIFSIGSYPVEIDAAGHDRLTAVVSHVPQLLSLMLLNWAQKECGNLINYGGTGFESMIRLAGSSYSIWGDIIQENDKEITECLDSLIQYLQDYKQNYSETAAKDLFSSGNDCFQNYFGDKKSPA